MFFMAVSGAAVLAFVSWVSLREAQRTSGSFIPDGRAPAVPAVSDLVRLAAVDDPRVARTSSPSRPRIAALRDATVAEADTEEALAAAAALWQVAVQTERD